MHAAEDAHELAILLHTGRDLDIVGDMTATVAGPSELLAWALILSRPEVVAWRSRDSGQSLPARHRGAQPGPAVRPGHRRPGL